MKKLRVLVTGHRGMLGTDLMTALSSRFDPVGLDLPELNITHRDNTIDAITRFKPHLVIHTAAFTDVDGCERFPDKAFAVNALGTGYVAEACLKMKIPLVYISTDFVFDGKKGTPYLEFDPSNPIQTYGRSKLAGEFYVSHLLNRFYIVRTAWLYGIHGKNFPLSILDQARQGKELKVVDDQIGSPTLTNDLCASIIKIVKIGGYGLYHAVNQGTVSRYDFARAILKFAGKENRVKPISSTKIKQMAKRPAFSALENFVMENSLGFIMPDWQDALKRYLKSLWGPSCHSDRVRSLNHPPRPGGSFGVVLNSKDSPKAGVVLNSKDSPKAGVVAAASERERDSIFDIFVRFAYYRNEAINFYKNAK